MSSIEFSLVEKSILLGLQQGNAVLKEIHKEMTVDMVEKLMGETEDAVAYQRVSAGFVLPRPPGHSSGSGRATTVELPDRVLTPNSYRAVAMGSQEIDEALQSKMSAEEEDAVQIELAAMVAEQDAARKLVSRPQRQSQLRGREVVASSELTRRITHRPIRPSQSRACPSQSCPLRQRPSLCRRPRLSRKTRRSTRSPSGDRNDSASSLDLIFSRFSSRNHPTSCTVSILCPFTTSLSSGVLAVGWA